MRQFFRKDAKDAIDVNKLHGLLGNINLIDIRAPYEYKNGHLPTAKNIPMNNILSEADDYLDRSKEYHIICRSGARSSRLCGILNKKGFHTINVSGGTENYSGDLEK